MGKFPHRPRRAAPDHNDPRCQRLKAQNEIDGAQGIKPAHDARNWWPNAGLLERLPVDGGRDDWRTVEESHPVFPCEVQCSLANRDDCVETSALVLAPQELL